MIQEKERLQLENLLALIYDLQQENWPYQNLTRKEALDKIIILAQILGVDVNPNDPDFLPLMTTKIVEISSQTESLETSIIPPNLDELVEIYEKEQEKKIADLKEKIENQESKQRYQKKLNRTPKIKEERIIQEAEKIVNEEVEKIVKEESAGGNYERYQNFNNELKTIILKTDSGIPKKLAEKMAQNATEKIITSLPPLARSDLFTQEIKNQVIQEAEKIVNEEFKKIQSKDVLKETEKIINNEFEKIKKESTKGKSQNFINEVQEIASTPAIIRPFQENIKIISPAIETALPQAILNQLAQSPEGVAYLPLYTVLYPRATAAFIERGIYTLPAKMLKIGAEEATPEWQMMANQGFFYEDFEASINHLKEIGVPVKHPLLIKLSDKADRFKEQQKIEYKDKNGNIFYKDTPAARILKHYYHFNKATGQQKIYDNDLKANLPKLSPTTDWSVSGYSNLVKRVLGRFRFFNKGYQKFSQFVTKGRYTSFLTPVKQFISKKFAQPVVQWLAKTAVGKAAKAGVKKAAGWLAVKLGVKMGIRAAAIAAAPESAGISLLIGLVIEAGIWLLGKIKNVIVGIINDPEKALMAIGAGVLILVFTSMPIALIGVVPIIFGGLGLASFTFAPIALGAAGAGISGFFIALGAAPIIFPVALFFIIVLSVLTFLTLFIVLVVSGAFILPQSITEVAMTTVSPYSSPYFNLTKTASVSHLENNQLPATITYTITIQPKGNYVLVRPKVTEQITVSKKGSSPQIEPCDFTELPEKITKTEVLTCQINLSNLFTDSAIVNVVNLITTIEGETASQKGMASASVTVGKPPGDCPSGWPVNSPGARITQGPNGGFSHQGQEAIDIAINNGTHIYAPHEGFVRGIKNGGGGGLQMSIYGTCNGISFRSYYAHLLAVFVTEGQFVNKGMPVADSDNTGYSTGPHLHYEFFGLPMAPPYIPINVPYGCRNTCGTI